MLALYFDLLNLITQSKSRYSGRCLTFQIHCVSFPAKTSVNACWVSLGGWRVQIKTEWGNEMKYFFLALFSYFHSQKHPWRCLRWALSSNVITMEILAPYRGDPLILAPRLLSLTGAVSHLGPYELLTHWLSLHVRPLEGRSRDRLCAHTGKHSPSIIHPYDRQSLDLHFSQVYFKCFYSLYNIQAIYPFKVRSIAGTILVGRDTTCQWSVTEHVADVSEEATSRTQRSWVTGWLPAGGWPSRRWESRSPPEGGVDMSALTKSSWQCLKHKCNDFKSEKKIFPIQITQKASLRWYLSTLIQTLFLTL